MLDPRLSVPEVVKIYTRARAGTKKDRPMSDKHLQLAVFLAGVTELTTWSRSQAYRGRQVKARRLYTEGKSIEEVAKIIGTDVNTAQHWIEGGK